MGYHLSPLLHPQDRGTLSCTCKVSRKVVPFTKPDFDLETYHFDQISASVSDKAGTTLARNVIQFREGLDSFAALLKDGTVVAGGDPEFGGDSSGVDHLLHDVVKIECSKFAFAALRNDGTVVAWNDAENGGDTSGVQQELYNITDLVGGRYCFAALRQDQRVICVGDPQHGGDTSPLDHLLDVGVMSVTFDSGYSSFIAKLQDGTKVMWPSLHGDAPFYIVPS